MILEEETFKKFGYHTYNLSPQSSKKIVVSCDECGKTREIGKRYYRIHCKSCAASIRNIKRWGDSKYRKKLSDVHKTRYEDPTEHEKTSEAVKNAYIVNPKYRENISIAIKEVWDTLESREKIIEAQKKGWRKPEARKNHFEGQKRRFSNPKEREKVSNTMKKHFEDPDFVKAFMANRNIKPNKLEQFVDDVLQEHFPDEWKYNGDGSCGVVLNGAIPDFININGKKAAVEVFGEAFHDPEKAFMDVTWKRQEFGRKAIFSQLGFACVILREEEIKTHGEEYIISTIKEESKK